MSEIESFRVDKTKQRSLLSIVEKKPSTAIRGSPQFRSPNPCSDVCMSAFALNLGICQCEVTLFIHSNDNGVRAGRGYTIHCKLSCIKKNVLVRQNNPLGWHVELRNKRKCSFSD